MAVEDPQNRRHPQNLNELPASRSGTERSWERIYGEPLAERYDRLVAALLPPAPESSLTPNELAIINGLR